MDLERTGEKLQQYCQLWELYVKASCELTKRSKISPEEAANACKVLGPYIRDIMQQFEEVTTIFMMERDLRGLKNRGHFPIPTITPQGMKIGNPQQARRILDVVLFLQKTHTIPRTSNICRRHPTLARKTRKHSENASTQKPKRGETIFRTSRILQKVCTQICRHFKSINTPHEKRRRIQMDLRV